MQKVIIKKLDRENAEKKGVFDWPVWEKQVSHFP